MTEKSPKKRSSGKKSPRQAKPKAIPPPKSKGPRRQGKLYGESEVARVRVPDATTSQEALRFHAGKDYIYDPQQRSSKWWWENHYAQVPWTTFRRWTTDDSWVAAREDHWRFVEAELARKIASEVVRTQAAELKELLDLRTEAFSVVRSGKDAQGNPIALPPVKSFEGAIRAALEVDKRVDEKRKGVLDELPLAASGPAGGGESQIAGAGLVFSDDELREMAQARMRLQQKKLEHSLEGEGEPEDDEGEK